MYIFLIIWLLLCYKLVRNNSYWELTIAILPVFILIAFRGETVGADTRGYLATMTYIKEMDSFPELIKTFNFEKGFLLLCFCIVKLGLNEQWLMIVEAFIFCISIIYFCKNNANDKFFILIALVLSLFEFTLSGIRQTFALSIFLFSYKFACERKTIIYILLALLALSFHTSSILVFPLYFLLNKKINKKIIVLYFLFLIFSLVFIEFIFNKVSLFFNYDEYMLVGLEGGYLSFILSVIFCLMIFERYKKEKMNIKFQQTSHYVILYMIFSAIRFVNIMMMRILLYLSVYPYLMIDSLKQNQISKYYKTFAIVYLIAYFIYRIKSFDNYLFYWE